MLVKKLGSAIIIKTKAYKILALISPLLMLCAILLTGMVVHITQTYEFQQPILRTKIFNLQPINNKHFQVFSPIVMKKVRPGIGLALIPGRISNQVIILASKCQFNRQKITDHEILTNVYNQIMLNNFKNRRLLAKNVALLCYDQREHLHNYIYQYQNARISQNQTLIRFGIIRNALIIQHWKTSRQVTKTYFNIYSSESEVHTDVDYYQAIKQLLQQVGLTRWQPCRAIDQSKLIWYIDRFFNKNWWSLFVKNGLCHLYSIWRKTKVRSQISYPFQLLRQKKSNQSKINNNYIFQQNGIQTGTLDIEYNQANQTQIINSLTRLGLSFINEFVVMEDHLHSSSTLFVPLSQSKFVPVKALIIPGLCFMLFAAIHLVIKAVYLFNQAAIQPTNQQNMQKQYLKNSLKLQAKYVHPNIVLMLCSLYLSSIQYYFNESLLLSIILLTIIRNNIGYKLPQRQKQLVRIILTGVNIFICEYFAIFCFPLSIIAIITSNIIIFFNKIITFILIVVVSVIISLFGQLSLFQFFQQFYNTSLYAQITLYPVLLWMLIS